VDTLHLASHWKTWVNVLSERWVQTCERLLERMKRFSAKKDKDRLDLVQSIRFSLYALHQSLLGWMNWVNNPDIMSAFKEEELEEMNRRITELTESFIKYDVEVTQLGAGKNLKRKRPKRGTAERRSLEETFYV
jgi:hypothetical protein